MLKLQKKKIEIVKKLSNTKFVESIDLSFKLNLKKIKTSEAALRTIIELPNGNGKKMKVAVLCDDNKLTDAKKSGAEVYGSEDLIKKISEGQINFDKLICTSSMMPKLGKLGKILGPKGLMPNPKTGTVTDKIGEAINNAKSGQVRFRTDKNGILHGCIGKVSFSSTQIQENAAAMLEEVKKLKPATAKGAYILSVALSSTMGPGVKVTPASLVV